MSEKYLSQCPTDAPEATGHLLALCFVSWFFSLRDGDWEGRRVSWSGCHSAILGPLVFVTSF